MANDLKRRVRSEEELREALKRFCEAVWNRRSDQPIFSIPVNVERDADCILADGIVELLWLRKDRAGLVTALESAALALEEAAKVLAGRTCNLPGVASLMEAHAASARAAIRKAKGG